MLRPSPNHGTQRLPNDDDDLALSDISCDLFSLLSDTSSCGHIHTCMAMLDISGRNRAHVYYHGCIIMMHGLMLKLTSYTDKTAAVVLPLKSAHSLFR